MGACKRSQYVKVDYGTRNCLILWWKVPPIIDQKEHVEGVWVSIITFCEQNDNPIQCVWLAHEK